MDGLFSLLIIIGIFALTSSNKKKKKNREKWRAEYLERKSASQAKIPFSKDEWNAFLKEQAQQPQAKPAPRAKSPRPVSRPNPVLHLEHDEPEGTVSTQGIHSTQGESAAEHARHRQRVLAEEQARQEQHESLQELRRMNTRRLRTAVVMSEVLGKPVSLRPRGYR